MRSKVQETIGEYDRRLEMDFDEQKIHAMLKTISVQENESTDCLGERLAFGFMENYQRSDKNWKFYHGPSFRSSTFEDPPMNLIDSNIIEYYAIRAIEAKNPILKCRYAGLVFDFSESILNRKPDFNIIKIYLQALISIVRFKKANRVLELVGKLERAYDISIRYNQEIITKRTIALFLKLERLDGVDNLPGTWCYLFDTLMSNGKNRLSDKQENSVIRTLLQRLQRIKKKQEPLPWPMECTVVRLAKYYKSKNEKLKLTKLLEDFENYLRQHNATKSPMQQSAIVEQIMNLYKKYNITGHQDRLLKEFRLLGIESKDEMRSVTTSIEIKKEQFTEYLEGIFKGNLEQNYISFILLNLPRKEETQVRLLEISRKAPLSYLMTKNLVDNKGRVIATIGPILDDLEGHLVNKMYTELTLMSIFFAKAVDRLKLEEGFGVDWLILKLTNSPIINSEHLDFIRYAIRLYLAGDYSVFVHLIIPQIESALRNLIELNGGIIIKQKETKYNLITFDEVLRSEYITEAFGEDIAFYFRVLYTDPRGWNLRNDICHGLINPQHIGREIGDIVFHSLLILSLLAKNGDL